jgi:hypothetical protein
MLDDAARWSLPISGVSIPPVVAARPVFTSRMA